VTPKLDSLDWKKRLYRDCDAPTHFLGKALYHGKLAAPSGENDAYEIIEMGPGRYDLNEGLEGGVLESDTLLAPKKVSGAMSPHP